MMYESAHKKLDELESEDKECLALAHMDAKHTGMHKKKLLGYQHRDAWKI